MQPADPYSQPPPSGRILAGTPGSLIVLGLGNILMGDDGIGVRVMEQARHRWWYEAPPKLYTRAEFIDAGTGGLRVLHFLERAAVLLAVDAADLRGEVGSFRWLTAADVRPESGATWSLHASGFAHTLSMAALLRPLPEVHILAIQPGPIEPGMNLSPALAGAVPRLAEQLLERIRRTVGAPPAQRQPPLRA